MYQQYVRDSGSREDPLYDSASHPQKKADALHTPPAQPTSGSVLASLGDTLGERLKSLHLDADLLIVCGVILFLVADSDDLDNDLLLLIGVLLFLGI